MSLNIDTVKKHYFKQKVALNEVKRQARNLLAILEIDYGRVYYKEKPLHLVPYAIDYINSIESALNKIDFLLNKLDNHKIEVDTFKPYEKGNL